SGGRAVEECVYERLLRTASVLANNTPARRFLAPQEENRPPSSITENMVAALCTTEPWRTLLTNPRLADYRSFSELRFYGPGYEDFSIVLLEAYQGEYFTGPQWRCLRQYINQRGAGIPFLRNLFAAINNDGTLNDLMKNAVLAKITSIQFIYGDAQ